MSDDARIAIRAATGADVAHLVAWNAAMAAETEGKALDRDVLERGVRAVIDDAARGFYLLAESGGEAAGSLMVTYEWSDWRNGMFWWIQSVYVAPTARRRGVFRALYHDIARRARAADAIGLRLYVERENTRAQQTYEGLGMQRCRYHMYESVFDI
jgi:ribosomal protein S18 acetylase RimI-like enzyme